MSVAAMRWLYERSRFPDRGVGIVAGPSSSMTRRFSSCHSGGTKPFSFFRKTSSIASAGKSLPVFEVKTMNANLLDIAVRAKPC